jgi:uncharacterized damage-inducible protein DinB
MNAGVEFRELIEFTDYERRMWRAWLDERGAAALDISTGAHCDRAVHTVGELIRHIFIAERHHVDRLARKPVTDVSTIPAYDIAAIFNFGAASRRDLVAFVAAEPAQDWDVPREHEIVPGKSVRVTPRKFVTHILLHEIRHWGQIATFTRLDGAGGARVDFLFSPVMGGRPEL